MPMPSGLMVSYLARYLDDEQGSHSQTTKDEITHSV